MRIGLMMTVALALVSCETSVETPVPGTKFYGVLPTLQHSIMLELDEAVDLQGSRRIRYPVCVTSDVAVADQVYQRYLQQEQESFNRWSGALEGETGWRVRNIELYRVGGSRAGSCPREDQGLRVYHSDARSSTTRANAAFPEYRQNISVNDLRQADWRLNLHELGHQFGLGDTYTEASYQTPVGQPAAVMNRTWEVSDFTQDDIDAVRHIWWMVRTGSNNPCADDYRRGSAGVNRGNTRFCVPLASDDDDGGGGQCRDTANGQQCRAWAQQGYCTGYYGPWMQQNCCGTCQGSGGDDGPICRNVANGQQCRAWAQQGYCTGYYGAWMQQNCCAACR
jgi:hypothetical protein